MLDLKVYNLPDVSYDPAEQSVELIHSQPTDRIDFRLSGTIEVTGTNADGVVRDDAVMRLIEQVRLMWDDVPLIDSIPGRDLYAFFKRCVAQEPTQTVPANADIQGDGSTFAFDVRFSHFFARPYLAVPWDTHLPALPVRNQLRLFTKWSKERLTSADDQGTGAIVASGTDVYTWAVEPTLEIWQNTSPTSQTPPWYVPVLEQFVTRTWAASTDQLVSRLESGRQFDMHLLRSTYGGADALEDSINHLSFMATGERFVDRLTLPYLKGREAELFPAVQDDEGYLAIRYAAGGLLTNRVNPNSYTDLRYEFGVDAPTSGNGLITITSANLLGVKGFTRAPAK